MKLKENIMSIVMCTLVVMLDKVVIGDLELNGIFTPFKRTCDISAGSWIRDDLYPLYDPSQCPFIVNNFNCRKYKRPDTSYLKYRWQPSKCDLPRFYGRDFLKMMKGKQVMFVGDSLSKNQWQSLACMIHATSIPAADYVLSHTDDVSQFKFPSINFNLRYDLTRPFLAELKNEPGIGRVLKLDSMKRGELWKKHDVLIFSIWHSWLHAKSSSHWDFVRTEKNTFKRMDSLEALEKVLKTWMKWIAKNINPSKTKVFLIGPIPNHRFGYEWGNTSALNCEFETEPVQSKQVKNSYSSVMKMLKSTVKKPVHLLDVTVMSQLRKDGHPGAYNSMGRIGTDCDNWCLPGVPDNWNEMLYHQLIRKLGPV